MICSRKVSCKKKNNVGSKFIELFFEPECYANTHISSAGDHSHVSLYHIQQKIKTFHFAIQSQSHKKLTTYFTTVPSKEYKRLIEIY